ncbi:hypothetical protein AB0H42_18045 [Nocardia sp. NPDC050799]|uniref:hypothetical protein n=1 Tax=Nocardia sp. NPDC050799 TaxID=3154842 RepID=UPI0033C377B7
MSSIGKWSLIVGIGLVVAAVLCRTLGLIPATVITGLIGLIALGIAGYDAVYTWLERAELRRRGAAARRNHEGRRGR